jgi:hypothetical protein
LISKAEHRIIDLSPRIMGGREVATSTGSEGGEAAALTSGAFTA